MADNNASVFLDQDFYGTVRFFGTVEFKLPTAGFLLGGDLILSTASKLHFDGGGDSYIKNAESAGFDIGIWASGTSVMLFRQLQVQINTALKGTGSSAYLLFGTPASATVPTLVPNEQDLTSGIGSSSAGHVSLIAGGLEALRISKNGTLATAPDFLFPLVALSGLSATPTNLEIEGLLGAPDDGTVVIGEDSDNSRVILLVRYSARWRWMAFANSA